MRKSACFIIAAALAVSGLYAQYRDLGEVSVTAQAWSPAELAPGGSVVVVTAVEIEKSGAANAAEALKSVAGFSSPDYGYPGSVRTPSLRGAVSGQILVIVDGVRRNDARAGNVDLADIPAESIERIEILKGGASSLYGADAVGGVIVVTTKHGGDRKAVIDVENRMYPVALGRDAAYLAASQRLGVFGQTLVGTVGLSASVSFDRSGDSFPAPGEDGSLLDRENTGLLAGTAFMGAEAPLLGGIISSSVSGRYSNFGVPGSVSWSTPNAQQRDRDIRGTAVYSNDALAGGRMVLNASAFGTWSRIEYEDPDSPEDSRHDSVSTGADLRFRAFLSPFLEIPAGLDLRYDAAKSSNLSGSPSRFHAGAYAAPILTLGSSLKVSPSVRYDWYDDYSAGLTYTLGVSAAVSDEVTLKMTGGRSYRAPSFNDLYWSDPYMHGNPDLLPETSWYAEAGGQARLGKFTSSLYGYARYTTDLITWTDADGDWIFVPENVSAAAFFGADAQATVGLGDFNVTASYALLLSYDLSGGGTLADDLRVANMPVHTVKLEPSYSRGPVKTSVRASWRSERYETSSVTLDPVFLLGTRVEYKVTERIDVYLDGENLFNTPYAEVNGYPMPGITLKTGVRMVL